MLRATIDADVFREAVDAIAALVSECRLHVDSEGMRTRAVDTANVAMVSLELGPDAFEVFEASESALGIDPEARVFFMEAEGDTDNIRLELGPDDVESLADVKARSLFSLDYLKDMAKTMSRASQIEIGIGIDHPVRFTFEIAGGKGRVIYLLAPRIEAD